MRACVRVCVGVGGGVLLLLLLVHVLNIEIVN